ncbi:MAG: cobaltochelatase subunit CobN, partial [Methanobrevibacter sp.]|nr:cobaltochelatase subunit CobN [Methanobrevibacter sp.]
ISCQVAFALENDTGLIIESNQAIESNVDLIEEDIVEDSSGSGNDLSSDSLNSLDTSESEDSISSQDNYTLFFISDNPGTNILDAASHELFNEHDFKNVNIIVRSGQQIKTMEELELVNLLYSSDAFIGEWISTDVDAVLTSTIEKYPDVVEKQIFLILEPPSGNMNSGSSSINLIKQNTINYNRILSSFSTDDIITYFSNTQRGTAYEDIERYIMGDGAAFNKVLNDLVLYKDINDKNSMKNQILYILNHLGYDVDYDEPNFTGSYLYGIYRERWFSLDEYIATYFDSSRTRTVGILESTMYVSSQQLHPTYAIIESLESKGYNVIPVFAAGGTAEQLSVMVESFTSAGSDISGFLANSSNYEMYVDAIISMVAYGVGGENFTKTIDFFEELGVPVFRAVHSDYVSNEQWELGSTGLTTEKSDKWWHVAIAEAQGIIDATFIGGVSSYISDLTGARIVTYISHVRNIDLLTDRVDSWVDLKYAENGEKVLSIIYYNYPPGKQNIGSSYLDTITSIYNMLYTLKAAGYKVEDLPNNVSELEEMILRCGINVANWAPGELDKLVNQSGVTLFALSEYTEWF